MAIIAVQNISRAGLNPPTVEAVAAGGDSFPNDGKTFVWYQNDHATEVRTLTVVTQKTVDGKAVADDTVGVEAADDLAFVGPFPPSIYNDANGRVQVTYSDAGADQQIGVIRLP
jgi:hypothetical protein